MFNNEMAPRLNDEGQNPYATSVQETYAIQPVGYLTIDCRGRNCSRNLVRKSTSIKPGQTVVELVIGNYPPPLALEHVRAARPLKIVYRYTNPDIANLWFQAARHGVASEILPFVPGGEA